ncbi:MAG: alcohol dehydrogenase catalytic domain-containing protein [Saprospiraceae bacterium]|nr:alcohol dehydrogenase catalytic domain-containing protein [Saprospiraceae bacterium]
MQALVKYEQGPGNVRLQDMPEPVCQDNQVLLEVDACGICGTDLHVYHDTFKNYPPVILGHEFVGKVVELGAQIKNISKGDTFSVLGATAITCGSCSYCVKGEFMFCKNRRGMGHGVHGAFAPLAVARPDQLYAVPDKVSLKEAALVEPLAAAVHAVVDVARFKLGDTILVSGPGPIGILCVKLLLRQSLKVLVAGTSQDQMRLDMAKRFGAARVIMVDQEDLQQVIAEETNGEGVDLALETAGAEASVVSCLDALRPMGHYVQVGHFGKFLHLPWDHVAFKQLRIDGSVGYTRETWTQTMKIIEQGFVASDIVTHELSLSDWKEGFELNEKKEAVKVILRP